MKPKNGGGLSVGYDPIKLLFGGDSELNAEESAKLTAYKALFRQKMIEAIRAFADELCEHILRCGEPEEE